MKNECSIIRDILPLYVENMVSEDTSEFVKEHLESCPACRAELEKLREPVEVQTEPQPDMDAAPLKRLKKALLMKKVQTILCTAAVLLALMLSVISFLTAPEYFTYSPELVTVTEEANGALTLSFSLLACLAFTLQALAHFLFAKFAFPALSFLLRFTLFLALFTQSLLLKALALRLLGGSLHP